MLYDYGHMLLHCPRIKEKEKKKNQIRENR